MKHRQNLLEFTHNGERYRGFWVPYGSFAMAHVQKKKKFLGLSFWPLGWHLNLGSSQLGNPMLQGRYAIAWGSVVRRASLEQIVNWYKEAVDMIGQKKSL